MKTRKSLENAQKPPGKCKPEYATLKAVVIATFTNENKPGNMTENLGLENENVCVSLQLILNHLYYTFLVLENKF